MEKNNEDLVEEEGDDMLSKPFAYKSIIDRYYTKYYCAPTKDDPTLESKDITLLTEGANLDQYAFLHSNLYYKG